MPEQEQLPLEGAKPSIVNKFIIPDDSVDLVPEKPVVAEEVVKTDQNTGAEATPAKPDAKPEPELTPEQVAKRSQNRLDRKLEKAFRQRAEAQAKADILERRLAELEKSQAPQAQVGEPKLEQFEYDPEKYATAKAEFAKTQATKEIETKQRAEFQKQSYEKLISSWETKAERGADKYDDWNKKVGELQPNSPLIAAIFEADNGEDIAHYLGSNPKEAQRIVQLPPLSQIREIGKLEAKLLSKPVEPKVPSKAPAPITPLSGASSGVSKTLEDADMKEFIQMRQKKLYGKR